MADFNPAHRQTYTPSQIQAYYSRIGLPTKDHLPLEEVAKITNTAAGLAFLAKLQVYHLSSIPFENLELHYSSHHTITLDPQHLFHKIVERNAGRGGYCMENSCLFGTVLRTLGYDIMSTGARVNQAIEPMAASKGWKGPKYDNWFVAPS
jgi:arylamine N-acetyltransferase